MAKAKNNWSFELYSPDL